MLQNEEQVIERILNNIDNYDEDVDFDTIKQNLFNSQEFATYDEAENEYYLEHFKNDPDIDWGIKTKRHGVFGAIDVIIRFEEDDFGEVNTDLSDPDDVANMIDYIRGNTIFDQALYESGVELDDMATKENIEKFKEAFNND